MNTHRLLVRGYRIPYEEAVEKVPEEKIVLKERLHPGKMHLVNTVQGKVLNDEEV